MNAVLLTDLTWTRIFSQLSFLSDKHLPSPLGSGYLISRLIYSQCGIYLNQWTLPRAIQKPRWDYYQHKVLVNVRMQWKSISFQCSGHKSLTLLLLRHWGCHQLVLHIPFHISAPPSKTFFIAEALWTIILISDFTFPSGGAHKDFCKIFSEKL